MNFPRLFASGMFLVGLLMAPVGAEPTPAKDIAQNWRAGLLRLPGGQGMRSAFALTDESGQVVIEWDAEQLLLPASTLKVATAVGILQKGGQGQQLTTRLQLSGQRLRCIGDYDPELTSGDLEDLTLQLVPKLQGKVQLEVSAPDSEPYPPGWSWDDLSSSFAPPISSLVFDHGLVPMKLLAGQQLQVSGPPWAPPGGLSFIPRAGEFEMLVLPGWENWVMAGKLPSGVEEAVTVPMLRPELAAARLLSEVLRRRGVQVEVVEPSTHSAPGLEVSHRSRPVELILAQGPTATIWCWNASTDALVRPGLSAGREPPSGWWMDAACPATTWSQPANCCSCCSLSRRSSACCRWPVWREPCASASRPRRCKVKCGPRPEP